MTYDVQEKLKPKGLKNISDDQIDQHWGLYKGYVNNFNGLTEDLAKAEPGSRHYMELKRRAGFEFDGLALHELYFGNLGAGSALNDGGTFAAAIVRKL